MKIFRTTFLITILAITFQIQGFSQKGYQKINLSNDLQLIKISDNVYVHVSWSQAPGIGRFSSNGLVYISDGKAFLFDTPVSEAVTKQLVSWIRDAMKLKIVGFIPNHWHPDCIGGLGYLKSLGIDSYANQMTIDITKAKHLPEPKFGFKNSLFLRVGKKDIECYYMGAGHTKDNIVIWLPSERILFPGCLVKDQSSNGLGNTADADLNEWPNTIKKIKDKFASANLVIPGHGDVGGLGLLDHTADLLKKK